MSRFRLPVLLAAGFALAPVAVQAHAIQTDIELLGGPAHSHASIPGDSGRIQLHSAFSTGEPARDASVRLIASATAEPVLLGRTDSQGRLAFSLPKGTRRDAEIQIDAGSGHRDWIDLAEIRQGRLQAAGPASSLRGSLQSLAPLAVLGLLGGLLAAGSQRSRG